MPDFFRLFFSFLLYIVVAFIFNVVFVLGIQELNSDIHQCVSILTLGSFSRIGYYSVLSRISSATQYIFSDYMLDIIQHISVNARALTCHSS